MDTYSEKAGIRIYYCHNSAHGNDMPTALFELEQKGEVSLEPLPCSGKIDPRYILKDFETGAHAVCVLCCPTGKCKSLQGNLRAEVRARAVREMLSEAGVDPESMQIFVPKTLADDTVESALQVVNKVTSRSVKQEREVAAI